MLRPIREAIVPALAIVEDDEPPTVVRASEIRALAPTRPNDTQTDVAMPILWEDEDADERAGTLRMIGVGQHHAVARVAAPSRDDEALVALVESYVGRAKALTDRDLHEPCEVDASHPSDARDSHNADPPKAVRKKERVMRSMSLALVRRKQRFERWLVKGGLPARAGFVVACAAASSIVTAILAR